MSNDRFAPSISIGETPPEPQDVHVSWPGAESLQHRNVLGLHGILKLIPDDGLILEFGVAGGDSFNRICDIVRPRIVYGFDSFYGLEQDWHKATPAGSFNRNGVPPPVPNNGELVIGRVEDTLPSFIVTHFAGNQTIAFAHMDFDVYQPTVLALHSLARYFRSGSILLFDEYPDEAFGRDHEQRAFAEFLQRWDFKAEFVGRRNWQSWAFRLEIPRAIISE